jgi:hypothetical protein
LYDLLPAGWKPHLAVSISGGGVRMFTNTGDLACPSVFLSVDTWQCLRDYEEARHYDVVFTPQKDYVRHLRAAGSRHVFWLPLACDPDYHHPVEGEKTCDISFAGSISGAVHDERRRLLNRLSESFSVLSLESVFGDACCRAMAAGWLAFNHSVVEDLNMRVFEAMAMGLPLLTNRASAANGLLDLFEDGKHLIVYDDEDNLVKAVRRYLDDDAARDRIAAEGRAEVLAKHTYEHRVDAILKAVAELDPRFGQADGGPVVRTDQFMSHLPRIPGRVLDIGLGLEASKYALRRQGVVRVVGLTRDVAKQVTRGGSYDAVVEAASGVTEPADTVVLADPAELAGDFGPAVAATHGLLRDGGTLVGRIDLPTAALEGLSGEDVNLVSWLRQRDFHLVSAHLGADGSVIFTARKRTRRLREIIHEVYTRLGLPWAPPELVASLLTEDA